MKPVHCALSLSLFLLSSCSAVECGPGTHLEGTVCVPNVAQAFDAGLPPPQQQQQNDAGAGFLQVHAATDWTMLRGAPLTTTTVSGIDAGLSPVNGGLYHLTDSASVLAVGPCGHFEDTCELRWLDVAGGVAHREAGLMVDETRLDAEAVMPVARRGAVYPCPTVGPLLLGAPALLHLDTGVVEAELAALGTQPAREADLGTLAASVYAAPPQPGACPVLLGRKRWSARAPWSPVLTAADELAASPVRFKLTVEVVHSPRRLQVLEGDREQPANSRVLFSLPDEDEHSWLTIASQDERRLVLWHTPGDLNAAGTFFTVDRGTAAVVHTFAAPSRPYFQPGVSPRWLWFCSKPVGATNETCVVEDAHGVRARQQLVAREHVWLRDDLYVLDLVAGAEVVNLQTDERTPLGVSFDDGHLRLFDVAGVHDFGEQATARPVLPFPAWGQQQTHLVLKTSGGAKALELWHAPSGRHVRVSNHVFASNWGSSLCTANLVTGVEAAHPGLYSFVELSLAGDGTGELFVGAADLLTPPRSLGVVDLSLCRRPRASRDGLTVGFMEVDGTNATLRRASLR